LSIVALAAAGVPVQVSHYLVSDSLWIVMALHAFVDVACGVLAVALLQDDDSTLTRSQPPAESLRMP
jgi:hypothetical protein